MRCWRFLHVCVAMLFAGALVGCGGGGDVGAPTQNAQVGDGGGGTKIQGTPRSTVAVGQTYSFQPDTSAAGGAGLTFTARNLPEWLILNPNTGRLTGTPTEADIGTYSGIVLEASDGRAASSLGPFTITVAAQGSGSASLSWLPPTENSDGSPLTDLAGYVVLYGQSPTELTETIAIDNPSVTTYLVEQLTSGTWYFAVQASNSSGVVSGLSGVASKTIS
jgi:hypothetical protein